MRIQFQTDKAKLEVNLEAQADFIGCLLTGVMACLPSFLDAFMRCLAGGNGPSTGFKPGDRARCD